MATSTNYIVERIREVWSKLSKDQRRFVDVVLHAVTRKLLGETIAKEYAPIRDSPAPIDPALAQIHIVVEAVELMRNHRLLTNSENPRRAIVPFLSEALASIVERDTPALLEYSKPYDELTQTATATGIQDAGAYAEAYSSWIEKSALYLQDCKSTVRAVSHNELTHLWDKPSALDYLATHYLLRKRRGCDSRRVFIYDEAYADGSILVRRLFVEVQVQLEAGVTVRLASKQRLQQIGKGYYYPLLSFGTYDRTAMGVLIPHDTKPIVRIIHDERQIRDAITLLDDIFDHAESALRWTQRNTSLRDSAVADSINAKVVALRHAVKSKSLD